ncbi:acyl-CoA thioesterase [Salsuginibacillus kocurii]|uniref:acyl-CoA thioesterase n=1 Tax=Salsuginibacillus kocurii TaxID=427078 RepID=UPI00035D959B|nr:thioesterase family protein [Salsuginibacillus kocurii]
MEVAYTKIEVRYAETDQMGVVHHSNYVVWCELGRTHFIEQLGFKYHQLEKEGVLSPVTNIDLTYKVPAVYGETVQIATWVESYDGVRVIYGYEIKNAKDEICVTGNSTHVCVNKETFRPLAIRKHLPAWHAAYEKAKK